MEKIITFDKQGRLYLPEEVRKLLQFKTLVMKVYGNRLIIEPINDDPIEALGKLGKEKLKGKSIEKLKKEARGEIEKDAVKKIR
jgi:bifunctional DNA-binding transcriptional regulator/antitoxin component of YhaV-PrlF toxin-antitoxin module